MDLDTTCNWMREHTWWILKNAKEKKNIFPKHNGKEDQNNGSLQNELSWILKRMFISRIDKITYKTYQNTSLKQITILDIDGTYCKINCNRVRKKNPQIPMMFTSLPFLMSIYKFHKNNYRWLTDAHGPFLHLQHMYLLMPL